MITKIGQNLVGFAVSMRFVHNSLYAIIGVSAMLHYNKMNQSTVSNYHGLLI